MPEEGRQAALQENSRSEGPSALCFLHDPVVDAKLLDPLFACPESAPLLRKAMYYFNLSWKQQKKTVATSRRLQAHETAAETTIAKPVKTPHSRLFPNIDFNNAASPLSFLHRQLTIEDVFRLEVGADIVVLVSKKKLSSLLFINAAAGS
jgi:hypothetical protein